MTAVDRMPGRTAPSWCPSCHRPPGPDCPDKGRTGKQVRQALRRELRQLVHDDGSETT